MIEIRLQGSKGRGKVAKIDDDDAPLVKGKRWIYNQGYAVTPTYPRGIESMHRLIMKCTDRNKIVDHINGDRLDNQRENLRIGSRFDNWKNKKTPFIPTEHEGIFFDPYKERYQVWLYSDTERLYGGRRDAGAYKTIAEAVRVRDAEVKHGGYSATRHARSWDALQRARTDQTT